MIKSVSESSRADHIPGVGEKEVLAGLYHKLSDPEFSVVMYDLGQQIDHADEVVQGAYSVLKESNTLNVMNLIREVWKGPQSVVPELTELTELTELKEIEDVG